VLEVQVTGRSVGRKRGHQVGPGGVLEVHETGGEYEKGGGELLGVVLDVNLTGGE